MTRYATRDRNDEIIALSKMGFEAKEIRARLQLRITVWAVHKIIERFHKQNVQFVQPKRLNAPSTTT